MMRSAFVVLSATGSVRRRCSPLVESLRGTKRLVRQRQFACSMTGVIQPPGPRAEERDSPSGVYSYLSNRIDPAVLDLCKRENQYVEEQMESSKSFRSSLVREMRDRIQETDASSAERKGPFLYYSRTVENEQYKIFCRRKLKSGYMNEEQHTPEIAPTDSFCDPEQVLVDENHEARKSDYYRAVGYSICPGSQEILAYCEDNVGSEMYQLKFLHLGRGEVVLGAPNACGDIAWASDGDQTVFYTTKNKLDRPNKVWRHQLGTDPATDELIFEEEDELFCVDVERSDSGKYILITSDSSETSKAMFIDAARPFESIRPVFEPQDKVEVSTSDRNGYFYLLSNADDATNFKLLRARVDEEEKFEIVAHRANVRIECIALFQCHLVLQERENGLNRLVVYKFESEKSDDLFSKPEILEISEETYSLGMSSSPFSSKVLRYYYSSLTTPSSTFEVSMNGLSSPILKKTTPILGGFDSSYYVCRRLSAVADDGTKVPISLVYRRDKKVEGQPTLLYGYGAYGLSYDATFNRDDLSLLDRGVLIAIAHVRGGGDMGRQWYLDGKYLKKKNSFTDFISCAKHLRETGYSGKICISGRSAGGLLIGASLNMAPSENQFFDGAILGVPFVDVLTTMLDDSLPLTVGEYLEWGNPNEKEYFEYMKEYSPVDNISKTQLYPPVFLTGGLNDPRVGFWEPLKFAQYLRNTGQSKQVLCKIDLGAGHFSKSGRFDRLDEKALEYAFLLDTIF